MIFTKNFYKNDDNRWFVDLPDWIDEGGRLEDLEMVLGADEMLDVLSNKGNSIQLTFSDEPFEYNRERVYLSLIEIDDDDEGAFYIREDKDTIWLCKVVKHLFGFYPKHLYII